MEASIVFERLFSDYLEMQAKENSIALHLKKLEKMRETLPMLKGITVDDNGKVSMDLRGWAADDIVRTLSKIFDSLMEVSAFTKGQETAFKEAYDSVIRVKKQFISQFKVLNIEKHILKGAFSPILSTGVEGMDNILKGGLPKGYTILLLGPSGNEKYLFAYQFIARGLRDGASCLVTTSFTDFEGLRKNISKLRIKLAMYENKGLLKIVDWYTYRKRNIVGIEEDGVVFKASKDITNLDIAINDAINKLTFAPTGRAVIDIISPAINIYDLSSVVELIQREKNRLKEKKFITLLIVERDTHDERTISTLKHISDGVISIDKNSAGELSIKVDAMAGISYDPGSFPLQVTKKGLSVVTRAVGERTVIKDFTEIPIVTETMARKLFEFGFTNLEKLEKAKRGDLIEVPGIDKEIAKKIYDYVHSVEYSQKIISGKSQLWLQKGMDFVEKGAAERAIKSYQRAIEINSGNAEAWFQLAKLLYSEGNTDDSKKCFDKAVSIDPGLSSSWFGESDDSGGPTCPVCGMSIQGENIACSNCGVIFTIPERQRFRGDS